MKPMSWSTVLALWGLSNVAWSQQWAQDLFQTKSHDFGTIAAGAKAEFAFVITNDTKQEIHIASVRSSCGCSDVRIENPTLQTYERGSVIASVNSQRLRGPQSSTITVVIDRPVPAEVQLRIKVFIRGDVVVSPSGVTFGEVSQGSSAEQMVTITRYGKPDWRVSDAEVSHPYLTTELKETERATNRVSYHLTVRLAEQMPAGYLRESVVLTTNDRGSTHLPIMVEGRVVAELSVAPAALYMGTVASGQQAMRKIVVRGKSPFKIVRAWADCDCLQLTVPEVDIPKSLYLLPVTFKASGAERGVTQKLHLETEDGRIVNLMVHAAVAAN